MLVEDYMDFQEVAQLGNERGKKEKPQALRPGAGVSWIPLLEGYVATR